MTAARYNQRGKRVAVEQVPRPPRLRLRYPLLALLLGLAVLYAYPRCKAAWELRDAATAFANYGACMVGPTGPTLLRDDPDRFWKLVRRRLIASSADEAPFEGCVTHALELTDEAATLTAHRARAWDFVEYGGRASDLAASNQGDVSRYLSVASLYLDRHVLTELVERAGPLASEGYTKLVKASSNVVEAPHPVELARPIMGQGLPSWRARYRTVLASSKGEGRFVLSYGSSANRRVYGTKDGGITWRPVSPATMPGSVANACFGPSRRHGFAFELTADARSLSVVSLISGQPFVTTGLAPGGHEVVAAACDDDALVVALSKPGQSDVELKLCQHGHQCQKVPFKAHGMGAPLRLPLDVARVDGITAVSMEAHGIVRVASSRDNGASWTPLVVAFDRGEFAELPPKIPAPSRLLGVGKRLLLYGGAARESMPYPVLVSDNYGASWYAPNQGAAATGVAQR